MRTLQVKGFGELKLAPDYIEVSIEIITQKKEHNETLLEAEKSNKILVDTLNQMGFNTEYLKSKSFKIFPNQVRVEEKYKVKYVNDGFKCQNNFTYYMNLDMKELNKLLGILTDLDFSPNFNVRFTLKDKNNAKKEMISKAVKDATEKALALEQASGVKLGKIQNIIYDWQDVRFYSHSDYTLGETMAKGSADFEYGAVRNLNINFNPEEINLSDYVTVIWELID